MRPERTKGRPGAAAQDDRMEGTRMKALLMLGFYVGLPVAVALWLLQFLATMGM